MSSRVTWRKKKMSYLRNGINRVHIYQHNQADFEMEPTGKAEEQLPTVSGGEDEKGRLQLKTVNGDTSWRSYATTGWKGLNQVVIS